ncbi:hypothetical protein [Clostridium septicum]|uniref:Twitching motility protein PilT n=1 Tax=Clostridium septicum TaxID=1504 RepID=A0A9N7JM44_CLOSE|nr:hypothetical protein [Clostridium septicum]AYE34908.1 hypothetical protein CP523_11075 [Clostridium septicum]MDU1313873.1 hypothetical protein [Clostridium septicum]QAS60302.1 hypothetical protein EI377_05865 [Clostridium septicum]UEC20443.1 hypothetical protein LK444_13755 [Clostridium septicum]USS01500.1 hypothetical protein NH397_03420 [Clostridium septicum]
MIQIFCASRGSGKTKRLIELANNHVNNCKGDSVYIDDDSRPMRLLKRSIRFVTTKDFEVENCNSLYGLLCGLISQNYDIENIYIDGLSNIVNCTITESTQLFAQLKNLANKFNLNLYINLNCDNKEELPEFIREYVA